MNNLTEVAAGDVERQGSKNSAATIPSLKDLFTPPLMANGLIAAFLLMGNHLLLAFGLAGGCAVGLIIFSALHFFAERVFGSLFTRSGSLTSPAPGNMLVFGALAGGKFLLVAAIMYVLIAVLHLSLVAFVIGFVITQLCVSISVINRLTKTKITD